MPWARVNNSSHRTAGTSSTDVCPVTSTTQHNLMAVSVFFNQGSGNASVADDASGGSSTYSLLYTVNDGGNGTSLSVLVCQDLKAGAANLTSTVPSSNSPATTCVEYSGLATSGQPGVTKTANASFTTATDNVSTGTQTGAIANNLIYGSCCEDSAGVSNITAGTGFNNRNTVFSSGNVAAHDEDINATGSAQAVTFTTDSAQTFIVTLTEFEVLAAGAAVRFSRPFPYKPGSPNILPRGR